MSRFDSAKYGSISTIGGGIDYSRVDSSKTGSNDYGRFDSTKAGSSQAVVSQVSGIMTQETGIL